MEFLINLLGFVILWAATDVGRKEDSKIKIFSKNWWLISVLICVGSLLSTYIPQIN